MTLEEGSAPGSNWVESLRHCLNEVDVVLVVIGDVLADRGALFELGVASALDKPTLLLVSPDYPLDRLPPSGVPYLRVDLHDEEAVQFAVEQAAALSATPRPTHRNGGPASYSLGPLADEFLARLPETGPHEFEDLIHGALTVMEPQALARGGEPGDRGVDFAVWVTALQPTIENPLLIECKAQLGSQAQIDAATGQMLRALEAIPRGCGLVLDREAGDVSWMVPRSRPIFFVSAREFLTSLRDATLAEYLRELRAGVLAG